MKEVTKQWEPYALTLKRFRHLDLNVCDYTSIFCLSTKRNQTKNSISIYHQLYLLCESHGIFGKFLLF